MALPAVSFDDVSVGAVRFGAPSLPTSRWQVGGRGGRGGRWGGKGEVGMEVGRWEVGRWGWEVRWEGGVREG